MYRIDADDLDRVAGLWDAAVDATPGADPFCSASPWAFSAAHSFPEAEPPVVVSDGHSCCGMRRTDTPEGRLLVGLDPIWGFATPVVGDPVTAARLLGVRLGLDDHDIAVVTGQHAESPMTAALVHVLGDDHRLLQGPPELRLRADLAGGADAWFGRRSPRFRQRLRRLRRDATDIEIVDLSFLDPDAAVDRIVAIEHRGWKGREETGLANPAMAEFYRRMLWRLAAADAIRLLIATRDGVDVGFVLGGVRGSTYRGLQLSYVEDVADRGVGHLLQWAQIECLDGLGVETYDLGMEMDYKRRWADRIDETFAVLITS